MDYSHCYGAWLTPGLPASASVTRTLVYQVFLSYPQESVQFTGPESVDDVILFVRKYRPRINSTFDPVMRTLEFDGNGDGDGGRELKLKLNDLVVYQHGELHVMPARMFLSAADDTDD